MIEGDVHEVLSTKGLVWEGSYDSVECLRRHSPLEGGNEIRHGNGEDG